MGPSFQGRREAAHGRMWISGLVIAPSSQWVALASAEAGTRPPGPGAHQDSGDLLRQGLKPSVNVASHLIFGNAVAFLDFAF